MEVDQQDIHALLSTVKAKVRGFRCCLQKARDKRAASPAQTELSVCCEQLYQFFKLLESSLLARTHRSSLQTDLKQLICWLDQVASRVPLTATSSISAACHTELPCQNLYPIRVDLQRHVEDRISDLLVEQKLYGDFWLASSFRRPAYTQTFLGEGAFGSTHRLENIVLGCVFAGKRVDLTSNVPQQFLTPEALQRECSILESIKHPNIARYLTSYYSDKDPKTEKYRCFNVVMELIEGGTLATKVIKGPGAPREMEIAQWAWQMASALSYMHSKHVYHRDLKLDNVMLTSHSEIKIIDLGLACQNESSAALRETLVGSPPYASYEKITGAPYDGRDDVWAVGIMSLELLIGERYMSPARSTDKL
jgi:hypothetical protein